VLGSRIVPLALATAIIGCEPPRDESNAFERHQRRVLRLAADRSTPPCTLPVVVDTTEWRRVPAPDAEFSFLLPRSFAALPDSPPRFMHGGATWRDGHREFIEVGVHHHEPAAGACRMRPPGVPVAFVTASRPGEPALVTAWIVGVSGIVDTDLVGQSPDPADRDLFLRVITTVRFDSTFWPRRRAAADSSRALPN
jgi:hypothetical protein